jgi:hypothetical protein
MDIKEIVRGGVRDWTNVAIPLHVISEMSFAYVSCCFNSLNIPPAMPSHMVADRSCLPMQ